MYPISHRSKARPYRPLTLERLEARDVPATFTVLTLQDAGVGSLRQAILSSPTWFKPHWMLAQVLMTRGRREEAEAEAKLAVILNGGKNPEVRFVLIGCTYADVIITQGFVRIIICNGWLNFAEVVRIHTFKGKALMFRDLKMNLLINTVVFNGRLILFF